MSEGGDEPRAGMSAYTFFVQNCREEFAEKHPSESIPFAEFSRRCVDRWKAMSMEEKQRFQQMAEKDRERHDAEMANLRWKRPKDPNAPKRSLPAFFWFSNDERAKVKESMPDSTVIDVVKEVTRRWNEVSQETRSKYEAIAAKDKARYVKELKAYKAAKKQKDSDESGEEEEEEESEDSEEEEEEESEEQEDSEEEEEDDDD